MLKYIAIITMLLDHINTILFDSKYIVLTIVGRLAFPLFMYMSVTSYMFYTSSKEKYIFRILSFAFITIPFYYVGFETVISLNIFFTIFLGLVTLYMIEQKFYLFIWLPFALSLYVDYSFFGVVCFIAFYNYLKEKNNLSLLLLAMSLFILNPYYLNIYLFTFFAFIYLDLNYKINFKSFLNKYVFYIFYPFHIALLGLLK